MPSQPKSIVFPVGGIHRSFAWQTQPPYSTVDAVNVRSAGAITGRDRGGSRPGLVRAFNEQLGSNPIAGTVAGATYDAVAETTRIVAAAPVFAQWMVGLEITFTVENVSARITAYVDASTVDVEGDMSAIACAVLLTGGTWPTWVYGGSILTVDGVDYDVLTRATNTIIRLSGAIPNVSAAAFSIENYFDGGTGGTVDVILYSGGFRGVIEATGLPFPSWINETYSAPLATLHVGEETGTIETYAGGGNLVLAAPGLSGAYTGAAYYIDRIYNTGTIACGAFTVPSGSEINCLGTVRPAAGTEAASLVDTFEGREPETFLTTSPWAGSVPDAFPDYQLSPYLKVIESSGKRYATGDEYPLNPQDPHGSAIASAVAMDLSKPYSVTIMVAPHNGAFTGGFYLYLRMHDTSPTARNCVEVDVTPDSAVEPGWWTIDAYRVRNGVKDYPNPSKGIYSPGINTKRLTAVVSGTTVNAYLDGVLCTTLTDAAPPGSRFGIGCWSSEHTTSLALIDEFRLDYSQVAAALDLTRPVLFTGAYGTASREDGVGQLVAIAGDVNLNASLRLGTAEWGGRLVVADYDTAPKMTQAGCTISDSDGTGAGKIIKHATATFNDKGIDVNNDACVVTTAGAGGAPKVGVYRIASVAAGSMTLTDVANGLDTGVSIRVERGPKVFNPLLATPFSLFQQTIVSGVPKGVTPTGCPLIAMYRDRLILGGNPPHIWYASRAGDIFDWNFGDDPDDPGRATGGASGLTGMIGKPLKAICRAADDYLIFGTATEIWALHGDPVSGGQMLDLSDKVGIVSAQAWTRMPDGGMAFLSHDGLYGLAPGGNSRPVPLSDRLPRELREIDLSSVAPILAYDPQAKGILVFLVPISAGAAGNGLARHWFLELKKDAFWRERYWNAHEPISTCLYPLRGVPGETLLLGCRDGVIRRYSDEVGADDGAPLDSEVLLGPFRVNGTRDLIINELIATLGETSGDVAWELYSADSAEAAYALKEVGTPSHAGGTWSAGRNLVDIVRHRDLWHYLLLKSPAGSVTRWEMEEIVGMFEAGAEYRPL